MQFCLRHGCLHLISVKYEQVPSLLYCCFLHLILSGGIILLPPDFVCVHPSQEFGFWDEIFVSVVESRKFCFSD
jgi:hypothetical protein